jgi:membrane-bound lytic murein transglycosylase MltF
MRHHAVVAFFVVPLIVLASGCGRTERSPEPSASASAAAASQTAAATAAPEDSLEPAPEPTPLPEGLAPLIQPFKGDLDGMIKRRLVRVLTVQNPVLYFVDRGREVGITYELVKQFEQELNKKLGNKAVNVYVVVMPVPRDELLPRLEAGEGDIAAAALTVTPQRLKRVDFSKPFAEGVHEVLVTGPAAPEIGSIDELSGKQVYVRPSSSYAEHLKVLNARFAKEGKAPVQIEAADEVLEDGDILEMVNAGLVPATVVDSFMADIYLQVFPGLKKHDDIKSPPGAIAWGVPQEQPEARRDRGRVRADAQGRLAQGKRARGQVPEEREVGEERAQRRGPQALPLDGRPVQEVQRPLPARLAADDRAGLPGVGPRPAEAQPRGRHRRDAGDAGDGARQERRHPDIEKLESNIHAGIKYNRWVIDNFYQDTAITPANRQLFAFASYNAGPGKVASLRREAKAAGLDPDRWFNNVELIAAKRIGRETVTYVSNIYKYYLAYQLMTRLGQDRQEAKQAAGKS